MRDREKEGASRTIARRGALLPRVAGAGALALLGAACSWYPAERGQRLEGRVDRIEEERPTAAQGAPANAASKDQLARVDSAVGDLRKRLDGLEAAPRPKAGPAEGQQELAAEVARLRASLDQQTKRLDAMERTLASASEAQPEREKVATPAPRRSEKPPRRASPPPAPAPAAAAQPPAGLSGTGTGQEVPGALALAREQEQKGDKGVARELYQQYVKQFPTDPASAEAHFRLGDLAYGERRYGEAITEFGKVAEDFPRSERAPEALLRTADSMIALGMRDDAALLLAEVPKRYPGSAAAARAKQRLSQLPKSSGAAKTNE
jgi:tol-pal system protein YbgF